MARYFRRRKFCKFTAEGTISVEVEKCRGMLRFTVADTGRGVDDEEQDVVPQSEMLRRHGIDANLKSSAPNE